MTPADEATFIALWQQGASQQELAQRLGVPIGTVKSRAAALARQGKIQARPKGGAYPHQRHQARQEGAPSTVHPLQADLTAALTAALQPVLAHLEALETGLARQPDDRPPSIVHPDTVDGPPSHRPPSTVDHDKPRQNFIYSSGELSRLY
jgi:DNA-binding transcriptional MocR family regulator